MRSVGVLAVVALAVVAVSAPTVAAPPLQPSISVSKTQDLNPDGETVTVHGSGYDETRGIYVAFCIVPPAGQTPTPCGGGVDLSGEGGASRWISSHPPDYGVGLAIPYGPGGSFEVQITVNAQLNEQVDCRLVQCAVVTRSDHTRLSDRSLDVIVPVFFRSPPPDTPAPTIPATPAPTVPAAADPTTQPTAPTTTTLAAAPSGSTVPPLSETSTTIPMVPWPTESSEPSSAPEPTPADEPTAPEPVGEPRGAAATWPVWVGTAGAVAGLAALAPRDRFRKPPR